MYDSTTTGGEVWNVGEYCLDAHLQNVILVSQIMTFYETHILLFCESVTENNVIDSHRFTRPLFH